MSQAWAKTDGWLTGVSYWALVAIIWFGVIVVADSRVHSSLQGPLAGIDLKQLYVAGHAVLNHRPIDGGTPFVYPPPMAVIWAPLAGILSFHQASRVDAVLQVVAVTFTIAGSFYVAKTRRWAPILGGLVTILVLRGDVVVDSFDLENFSVLLAPFALIFIWLVSKERWRWATGLLVLSLVMKPILVPFMLIFALRRRWTELASAIGAVIVICIAATSLTGGAKQLLHTVRYVLDGSSLVGQNSVYNDSLRGLVQFHHFGTVSIILLRLAIIAVLTWVVIVVRNRPLTTLVDITAVTTLAYLALLLAGSLSEVHYLFAALPALIIVGVQSRRVVVRLCLAIAALLFFYSAHFVGTGFSTEAGQLRIVLIEFSIFMGLALSQILWQPVERAPSPQLGDENSPNEGSPKAIRSA